ncbi:9525_t:CDS:2, partial [Racocetra fulgida]
MKLDKAEVVKYKKHKKGIYKPVNDSKKAELSYETTQVFNKNIEKVSTVESCDQPNREGLLRVK